jgi:hypothetical protein
MNRCAFAAAAALLLAATAATAQSLAPRQFPATALRGDLVVTAPPEVMLNKRPARLAPGARIRGTDHLQQLSGGLVGQRFLVNYTLDLQGQLLDVWILTPAEARRQPWPTTPQQAAAWRFDPDAQVWSKP